MEWTESCPTQPLGLPEQKTGCSVVRWRHRRLPSTTPVTGSRGTTWTGTMGQPDTTWTGSRSIHLSGTTSEGSRSTTWTGSRGTTWTRSRCTTWTRSQGLLLSILLMSLWLPVSLAAPKGESQVVFAPLKRT